MRRVRPLLAFVLLMASCPSAAKWLEGGLFEPRRGVFERAQHAYYTGDYYSAERFAQKVDENDENYIRARYLLSMSLMANGRFESAEKILMKLQSWMELNGHVDANIRSLIHANLDKIQSAHSVSQAGK